MRSVEYWSVVQAVNLFIRHRPAPFAGATAWIGVLRQSLPRAPKKSNKADARPSCFDTLDYRHVESVIRRAQWMRHQAKFTELQGDFAARDAFRILLIAWLVEAEAHSLFDNDDARPDEVKGLPHLSEEQLSHLRRKFALHADPDWQQLVQRAWDRVGDPRYLQPSSPPKQAPPDAAAAEPSHKPPWMPLAAWRAYRSDEWARTERPDLYKHKSTKYPEEAYDFVKDKQNGCPAYEDRADVPSYDSWVRFQSQARRLLKLHGKV